MSSDADVVSRINRCKNLYDVLQVPKTATEEELKRAYKKLALATHPDKNKAPGAEDAFKLVGKAFSTLSDAQKRAMYDRYGEEGLHRATSMSRQPGGAGGGAQYQQYEFEADDIYDLFAQMFGGDPRARYYYTASTSGGGRYTTFSTRPRAAYTYTHGGRAPNDGQAAAPTAPAWVMRLFQLLPMVLFFVVFILFSTNYQESLPYSLTFDQVGGYTKKRYTRDHHITYYVPVDFDTRSDPTNLYNLEQHVYSTYIDHLNRRCKFEQQEKSQLQQRARYYYSGKSQKEMLDKANKHPTKSCSDLQSLLSQFGRPTR